MTEWLVGLSLFNLVSVASLFMPRAVTRARVPWGLFAVSLLASELAWLWLVIQLTLGAVFVLGGGAAGMVGQTALLALVLSWLALAWSMHLGMRAEVAVEDALQGGLGEEYRKQVPDAVRERWRARVQFADWSHPLRMRQPSVEVVRGIRYGRGGIRQQLDVYKPRVIPPGGCPVLLQIHGGAWMIGTKEHQALPLMYLLASRGWICVAANYRLSPSVGFPVHLQDCKRALCWIRNHGHEHGMNTRFVAVTGGSAGGHLAALMALTANRADLQPDDPDTDTTVQACVPFYGVYDFLDRYAQHKNRELVIRFLLDRVMHESPEQDPALWDLASPVAQIHEHAPPFMLVHGALDSLSAASDGRAFAQRLRRSSNKPVVYLELPGAEHGFDGVHSPRTEAVINGVHRFLEWVRANP